jgi:hypothetical protein
MRIFLLLEVQEEYIRIQVQCVDTLVWVEVLF